MITEDGASVVKIIASRRAGMELALETTGVERRRRE
jgi:hypothetical protein